MTRSLVTGGAGFIGQHLVRQLATAGEEVRVLDLQIQGHYTKNVEFFQGSILDEPLLSRALKEVDYVYHLAANAQLWAPDPDDFMRPNYRGTQLVMGAACRSGVKRIVYTSTESILGSYRQRPNGPIDERTPLPPLSGMPGPYARSKWLAEHWVRKLAAEGHPIVIVYPTTPVGPGDYQLTSPTRMIRDFVSGKTPAYLDTTLNWIDVRDIAEGHRRACLYGKTGGRYILGNENLPLRRILDILEKGLQRPMPKHRVSYALAWTAAVVSEFIANHLTGRPPVASLEGVRLARAGLTFDCSRAREELGLQPRPVDAAIIETVRWLREQQLLEY
jgi:dihydroflavonol-4-reductase